MQLLRVIFSFGLIFSACSPLSAQKIMTLEWETKHAAAPVRVAKKHQLILKMIRTGAGHVPETKFMQFSGAGAAFLGLDNDEATHLGKLISAYYRRMQDEFDNGKFPAIPTAVAYCYSGKKLSSGLANVYVPETVNEQTSVILFLHGYGGNFSFYLHYFATLFPDSIILCPAYGISMADVPDAYLKECLTEASRALDISLTKPVLIGLSAGGTGGFRHYARCSTDYAGFVSIVSFPPKDVLAQWPKNTNVRMIAGGKEAFVQNGTFVRHAKRLKLTSDEVKVVKEQGHFLILEEEGVARKWLKQSLESLFSKK